MTNKDKLAKPWKDATRSVIETRRAIDAALSKVPNKRYSLCSSDEQKAFDNLALALREHRQAVKVFRKIESERHESRVRSFASQH